MTDSPSALKVAHRADRALSREAAKVREEPAIRAIATVGEIADQPPLIALSAATIVLGAALRRKDVARAGARMLASHLLATAIKTAIKHRIDRTRPEAAHEGMPYALEAGGDHGHDFSSFPSGHTAGAVAVARAITRELPGTTPYAAAGAVAVGLIQLPNAKHYASDVIAGAVVGLVAEAIVDRAAGRLKRAVDAAANRDPHTRADDRRAKR